LTTTRNSWINSSVELTARATRINNKMTTNNKSQETKEDPQWASPDSQKVDNKQERSLKPLEVEAERALWIQERVAKAPQTRENLLKVEEVLQRVEVEARVLTRRARHPRTSRRVVA
jgi:hypothetical protein